MKNSAATFLSEDEKRLVTEAVHRAEKKSSGEIVPMIVSRSYSYPLATHLGALLLGMLTSLILTPPLSGVLQAESSSYLLFCGFFISAYFLFTLIIPRTQRLHRFFITEGDIEDEVREGAITAFFMEQLYKTKQENGVLLYISVFERKVWVLGDAGVNAVIDENYWNDVVSELVANIRIGKRCQGICRAVDSIGESLAAHFPIKEDNVDELHNLIIRD
ncbi:TPM domain-containing protein [Desulfogranum japonicum]|uniref:TPM domain-containing protein n=1 Tax=Desulfogranum japonicum TaxID=231447 RepID=UPI00041FF322|nr:TPM domain-containing protein [Desulfogranum japonicum]